MAANARVRAAPVKLRVASVKRAGWAKAEPRPSINDQPKVSTARLGLSAVIPDPMP
jgi:hypothetical protein